MAVLGVDQVLTRRILLAQGVAATWALPAVAARQRLPVPPAVPPPATTPPPAALRPLVVLDPGHGGKDPGAIGVSGTYEKHVALDTAHELQRQLRAAGQLRVELTRANDVFIPLEQRVAWAQRRGAALFVSMHADALADRSVRGASVYTLAGAASDAQTAALARRENDADRYGEPQFGGTSPAVAAILSSLVRQETRVGSARMARSVVSQFHGEVGLLANPARHAGFVVLKAADIPSVLVEMGFMSNGQDEAALREASHRAVVAVALRRAIEAYFAARPVTALG